MHRQTHARTDEGESIGPFCLQPGTNKGKGNTHQGFMTSYNSFSVTRCNWAKVMVPTENKKSKNISDERQTIILYSFIPLYTPLSPYIIKQIESVLQITIALSN